jgi:hypothetical protein
MTQERLEEYLVSPGADYVITVKSPERAKLVAAALSSGKTTAEAITPPLDLRAKLEFVSGGKTILLAYADATGHILYRGSVMSTGTNWIEKIWQLIRDDSTHAM